MKTLELTLHIDSYIAHPYWPERERLINITKESGMSRTRSSANARKSLSEYLEANNMTLDDFDELQRRADRQFYTVDGEVGSEIVVPELHVMSMIVNTCHTIRAAGKPCPPDQARSVMVASPWNTGKKQPDGVWERFAVVNGGTGAKLSNQRGLRRNEYIADVTATGTIDVELSMIRPPVLQKALEWAGQHIGIGASRKMGYGRFQIVNFEETN